MIKGDKHKDEMIFDYIEGNLSEEQKALLEMEMLEDEGLKEQVEMWEMTLLDVPLVPTDDLEEKLYKSNKGRWWQFSLNSFFGIGFLLLLLPNSLTEDTVEIDGKTAIEFKENTSVVNEIVSPPSNLNGVFFENKKTVEAKISVLSKIITEEESIPVITEMYEGESLLIYPISKKGLFIAGHLEPIDKHVVIVKKEKKRRVLTQKEKRALDRKIRKDMEKRLASKFRKGRVPYVVPLDVSNF